LDKLEDLKETSVESIVESIRAVDLKPVAVAASEQALMAEMQKQAFLKATLDKKLRALDSKKGSMSAAEAELAGVAASEALMASDVIGSNMRVLEDALRLARHLVGAESELREEVEAAVERIRLADETYRSDPELAEGAAKMAEVKLLNA
jgi:hypothetical protein